MADASERIKTVLQERRLSYADVADEIGITPQAVYAIVNGKTTSKTARYSLAKALDLDVADLWPESKKAA